MGQEGKITAVNGRDVTVAIGVMKMNVSMKDCILTKAQPVSPQKRTGRLRKVPAAVMSSLSKGPGHVCTDRCTGETVDEAIPDVDKAIDDALLAGMDRFRLVHGKGTGMLRKGLLDYLKQHPNVKKRKWHLLTKAVLERPSCTSNRGTIRPIQEPYGKTPCLLYLLMIKCFGKANWWR